MDTLIAYNGGPHVGPMNLAIWIAIHGAVMVYRLLDPNKYRENDSELLMFIIEIWQAVVNHMFFNTQLILNDLMTRVKISLNNYSWYFRVQI